MLLTLRKILDKHRDKFGEGGFLEKYYPIFEATDTILFSTDEVTESGPHVRDSIDTKRIMILVVLTLLPLYFFGAINVGYQNTIALSIERTNWENFWFGFNQILPIIIVTFASGAFWELLFAVVRKHPVSEGFLVTCSLIPLTMARWNSTMANCRCDFFWHSDWERNIWWSRNEYFQPRFNS